MWASWNTQGWSDSRLEQYIRGIFHIVSERDTPSDTPSCLIEVPIAIASSLSPGPRQARSHLAVYLERLNTILPRPGACERQCVRTTFPRDPGNLQSMRHEKLPRLQPFGSLRPVNTIDRALVWSRVKALLQRQCPLDTRKKQLRDDIRTV